MSEELWLVGKLVAPGAWEVQGLYRNEADAAARCEDIAWFVMPLTVDQHITSDRLLNPRAYYPKAR